MQSLERQVCGFEGLYHPGHPVTIAVLIMTKYPSLTAANEREDGTDFKAAIVDGDIPGSGTQVHDALEILGELHREGPEAAFARGTRQWKLSTSDAFTDRQGPGQAQAERLKHRFFELAAYWPA